MQRQTFKGVVVSDKCNKTITVQVVNRIMHPKYKKYIKRRKKYAVHDENNLFKVGDRVKIVSTRPISKTKKWVVVNEKKDEL